MKSYNNAQYARLTEKGKPKPTPAQRRAQGEAYRAAIMRFGAPEPEAAPEPVAQEAARSGGRFRRMVLHSGGGPCVVRIRRVGRPGVVEREFAVARYLVHEHGETTYIDLYCDPDTDAISDIDIPTDAHTDANPDRDAVPDLDAAPDVDTDAGGDDDGSADADNGADVDDYASADDRAWEFFRRRPHFAGFPRTPGACTFIWRDAGMDYPK